jgi:hypothetical protein
MENSYAEGIAVGIENAVGVGILRRRQFYTDGQLRGLPDPWPTPTAPTFGRRHSHWPLAYCTIPVVLLSAFLFQSGHLHGQSMLFGSRSNEIIVYPQSFLHGAVIRLKRIYNFLCSMLVFTPFA